MHTILLYPISLHLATGQLCVSAQKGVLNMVNIAIFHSTNYWGYHLQHFKVMFKIPKNRSKCDMNPLCFFISRLSIENQLSNEHHRHP